LLLKAEDEKKLGGLLDGWWVERDVPEGEMPAIHRFTADGRAWLSPEDFEADSFEDSYKWFFERGNVFLDTGDDRWQLILTNGGQGMKVVYPEGEESCFVKGTTDEAKEILKGTTYESLVSDAAPQQEE